MVAPLATRIELLLFADGEASEPARVVGLDQRHRSADHWHVEVDGLGLGSCYGYRHLGRCSLAAMASTRPRCCSTPVPER